MLKNVVLPAPFGPIRLTMERSGLSKFPELTATSPPKTLVIPRASMMLATFSLATFSSLIDVPPQRVADVPAFAAVQLLGPLAVGDYSLRPQEHHDHEQDAEQEEVVLGHVRFAQGRAPHGVTYRVHP